MFVEVPISVEVPAPVEAPMSVEAAKSDKVLKFPEVLKLVAPDVTEAPVPAETAGSVDAPNPAETPTPPDADDSAASASIANIASTISFFFIMLILQIFNTIFKSKARLPRTGSMKINPDIASHRRISNSHAIKYSQLNQVLASDLAGFGRDFVPDGRQLFGAFIKRMS